MEKFKTSYLMGKEDLEPSLRGEIEMGTLRVAQMQMQMEQMSKDLEQSKQRFMELVKDEMCKVKRELKSALEENLGYAQEIH